MENQKTQQRIKAIYQMLFEMATGNLSFRIFTTDQNDEVTKLSVMLNTTAEKMELLISELGYINPPYKQQSSVQATIILDNTFTIKNFSAELPSILGYKPEKLLKLSFHEILAKQSLPLWEAIMPEAVSDKKVHTTVQFLFITPTQHLVPSYCTFSRQLYNNAIVVSSVTTIHQNILPETRSIDQHLLDLTLIQNVQDYILNHIEDPLPSTKELSKIFNVNEFKLKDSFRHLFNTSIYQFYTDERLKRAQLLILQTKIPLKEIAFISGYNDYTNFYKAFKKRFSYSPSELKRKNHHEPESE
jgi:AraC-like DNA-binding protein